MTMPLQAALAQLDPGNDAHWTADGLPAMAVVNELTGGNFTRKNLPADFTREAAKTPAPTSEIVAPPPTTDEGDANAQGQGIPQEQGDEEGDEEEVIVEINDDELFSMDLRDLQGIESFDAFMAASDKMLTSMHREREEIAKKIDYLSRRADMVQRVRAKMQKQDPNGGHSVKAFLKKQAEARMAKSERAKAFLNAGTTAQDVVAQLNMKAPIDAAMAQRKAKPGTTRPAMGMPVRK